VKEVFTAPLHVIFYSVVLLASCVFFSRIWIDISGTSARELARQLTEREMIIKGMREESMTKYLNGYIPIAAMFGGVCLGLLSILADMVGALGSGTAILLAVTIIYQQFEVFARERERIPEAFSF
jgi:protein transport protein SEC61 subunit alpha